MLRLAAIPLGAAMVLGAVVAVASSGPGGGAGVAQGPPSLPPAPSETPSPTPSETPSPTPTAVATTAPPPTTPAPTTPAPKPVKCGTTPISPMSDGVVSGTVVDTAGRPLANIAVYSPSTCGSHAPRAGVNRTDAQGRFAIPCTSQRSSWVVASPFEWWTRTFTTTAPVGFGWLTTEYGKVPCGGNAYRVVLLAAATVKAQLVDAAGRPVAPRTTFRLKIGARERDTAERAEGIGTVVTDESGLATVTGLAPGTYLLLGETRAADGTVRALRRTATVSAGRTTTVQVVVEDTPSPSPTATPTPTATTGADMPVTG
jgi:protocatechuate 3,4-dioxygenase beta subunit